MDTQSAIQLQDKTFRNSFDQERFARFIKELFNEIDINILDKTPYIVEPFKDYIAECKKIAKYTDSSNETMEILAVKLKRTSSRDRARTMQRNFVSSWLSKYDIDAALVAFYSDDDEDWRFSYVKMEYDLIKGEDGIVRPKTVLTPARRYSFLVGKNEPNHTCQRQFLDLVMNEEQNPLISEIEKAFSIENVTKEFFEKYKELALNLKEALDKIVENDTLVQEEFKRKGITTIDFSKKLLGQIVFLYFLQKKGWLGVQKGPDGRYREWGTGPKDFLRQLFEKKIAPYDNFFNDVLEPLFYEALATDRRADHDYYGRLGCRIPFLNGGLFEPINDYDWVSTDITIPNEMFSNTVKTKDGVGTGILDVFDRYNFTVKEDEPLEKEVAVDPEMLGKVFENLLEVKDRKSKGAFYTPREIVHYMCQQSLINYLETNTTGIPREDIEKFILYGDLALGLTVMSLKEKKEHNGKSHVNEDYVVPKSISDNFREIDRLLQDIKIVDPAVGSGAFPVGMMNEIVKARSILTVFFPAEEQAERSEYNLKRQCIESSLYGVDIDPSAVEIAKLRFWLSLIVDEENIKEIKPLPNLDHKIMCGNSLLEEFEGKKLFDEKLLGDVAVKTPAEVEIEDINYKLRKLKEELKDIGLGSQPPEIQRKIEQREGLKKRRDTLEKKLEKEARTKGKESQKTIDDAINRRIRESQEKLKEYISLQKEFFKEPNRTRKKGLRQKMEDIEWEFIEATLREQGNEEAMTKLEQYRKSRSKPFFLWKLYFSEVFQRENPGFDVVIGNPPYIRVQNLDKSDKDAIKAGYSSATKNFDIYVVFDELGLNVLRLKGTLCYIQPNKFFNSDYGIGLRKIIRNNQYLSLIVDFRANQIFSTATTYTCIFMCRKVSNETFKYISFTGKNPTSDFLKITRGLKVQDDDTIYETFNSDILKSEQWSFSDNKSTKLFDKIRFKGEMLGNFAQKIFQGIITGKDSVYILENTNNGYFSKHNNDYVTIEEGILKPLLKGKEINRYKISEVKYWVIFPYQIIDGRATLFSENFLKNQYPKTWGYLSSCETELRKRDKRKMDHDHWYGFSRIQNMAESSSIKIMTQVLARKASMTLDFNGEYCFVGGGNAGVYGIILKEDSQLEYLYVLALLNSKLLDFYLQNHSSRFQNGYFSYAKRFIENIPILKIEKEKQSPFIKIVNEIYTITKSDDYLDNLTKQAEVKRLERQIDQLVYKLYDLTPEEIKIVEEFTAEHQSKKRGRRKR